MTRATWFIQGYPWPQSSRFSHLKMFGYIRPRSSFSVLRWVYVCMFLCITYTLSCNKKISVWCINLNIAELFFKLALILRVSESFWGAHALNVFNRSPKFGQNMRQVVLNIIKFQIYATIIIMLTMATWLTQNYPTSKVAFFLSWELAAISCHFLHPVF